MWDATDDDWKQNMGVSKDRGKNPKMDGENRENPIKMDDLGVPLFLETPTYKKEKSPIEWY